ncbi:MAG: hypothetical protein KTR21_03215 [Rhodobacteraceae bacterium]|nr:hypothetical protein [Paracoccaceae bacterium]
MSRDAGQERVVDASTVKVAAEPRLFTKYVAGLTARSRVGATPPECRRLLKVVDGLDPIEMRGVLLSSRASRDSGDAEGVSPRTAASAPDDDMLGASAEARGADGGDQELVSDPVDLDLDDLGGAEEGLSEGPPIWEAESAEAVDGLDDADALQASVVTEGQDDARAQALGVVEDYDEGLAASMKEDAAASEPQETRKSTGGASKLFMAVTAAVGISITALVVSVQEAKSPSADPVQQNVAGAEAFGGAAPFEHSQSTLSALPSQVDVYGVLSALRQAAAGRGDIGVLASLNLDETGAAAAGSGAPVAGFAGLATFEISNGCRQRREVAFEAAAAAPSGFFAAMGPVIDEVCGEQFETGSIRPAPTQAFTPTRAIHGSIQMSSLNGAVLADFSPSANAETAPIETEMLSALALADGSLSNRALTDLISRLPMRCVISGEAAAECAERTVYAPDTGSFTIIRPLEAGGRLEMRGDYEVRDGALCHQSIGLSAQASGGGLSLIEAARLELREEAAFAVAAGRALCHRFTPKPAMNAPNVFVAEAFVDGEPAPSRTDPRAFRMRPMEIASGAGT